MSQDDITKLSTNFAVLENQVKNVGQKVDDMRKDFHDFTARQDKIREDDKKKFKVELDKKADANEVERLRNNVVWIVRLVFGILITAALGALIKMSL